MSWFDVRQLLATGMKALTATAVGSMSGRRELMAALEPGAGAAHDLSARDEIWIDYIADTGDGWNATASVAWLAGRDSLKLHRQGGETAQPIPPDCRTEAAIAADLSHLALPGGEVMVLGGDQVYPTASPKAYQRRFIDPFRSARHYQEPGRQVFAVPGNHDWYDGLTSFLRLFCQTETSRRWFGAWQAQQRRSYFALKLPHGWWLWGVDMALEDDLDPPQYDYFRARAAELQAGDRLILCVPSPTWLQVDLDEARRDPTMSRAADKLSIIMDLARKQCAVNVPLVLTGDLHYYAHHDLSQGTDTRHYIVCGGGGAFGLGTTQTPRYFAVPGSGEAELRQSYPDGKASARLRWGALRFPFINYAFTATLAVAHLILLWLLNASAPAGRAKEGWINCLTETPFSFTGLAKLSTQAAAQAFTTPGLFIWLVLLLVCFALFGRSGTPKGGSAATGLIAGGLHGLLQIIGGIGIGWLAFRGVALTALPAGLQLWVALLLTGLLCYLFAGLVFGLYLVVSHVLTGLHDQEVYSAQGIESHKSFLRLHISAHGLTVFPIGLRQPAAVWTAAPGVTMAATDGNQLVGMAHVLHIPRGCQRILDPAEPLAPHLIEPPIFIPAHDVRKATHDL